MPSGVYKHKCGYKHPPRRRAWSKKLGLVHRGKTISQEQRRVVSEKLKGRYISPNHRHKISLGLRGKPKSLSHRKKISVAIGSKKGWVSTINQRIRHSVDYRLWRVSVFKRDNWTCVFCGTRGGVLNADHIKPFAYYPELRFAIDNGRTLCKKCHLTTDTYAWKSKK